MSEQQIDTIITRLAQRTIFARESIDWACRDFLLDAVGRMGADAASEKAEKWLRIFVPVERLWLIMPLELVSRPGTE